MEELAANEGRPCAMSFTDSAWQSRIKSGGIADRVAKTIEDT